MKNLKSSLKISFTGDILCDFPELKYAKKRKYNFKNMFENLKLKENSDLLIGNLETPICSLLPYTFEPYSFNSPIKFLQELKKIGFDILSIANNHCLDRGELGAIRTIEELKNFNIIPSGIYYKNQENYDVVELKGKKIAFISYTYGTNYNHNHYYLGNNSKIKVNLLKKQDNGIIYSKFNYVLTFLKRYFKSTTIWKILKCLKNLFNSKKANDVKAYIKDDINNSEWIIDNKYIERIEETIKNAKSNADVVIFLLHSGGQFNAEVGSFSKKIVDIISKSDVDIIIGNHPHIVQKYEIVNGKPVFYSLGNFSFSPMSDYVNFECKPDYSLKVNMYISENDIKYSFEILKTIADKKTNHSAIVNTYDLEKKLSTSEKEILINDCNYIINRVYDTRDIKYITNLSKEYLIDKGEYQCQE